MKKSLTFIAVCAMVMISAFAEDPSDVKTFDTKMPVLSVSNDVTGHCTWFPLQYSRTLSGEPLKVLIADDTPGGVKELLRNSVWMAATTVALLKNDPLDGARITIEFAGDIDGPSAGSAICLGILLAMDGIHIPEDFAITGTIMPDGSIGMVGCVAQKIEAAAANGVKRICIPAFCRWEKQDDNQYVDLFSYCEDKGVKIYPIRTIEEAYKIITGRELCEREFLNERDVLAIPKEVNKVITEECHKYFGNNNYDRVFSAYDNWDTISDATGFSGFTDNYGPLLTFYNFWDKSNNLLALQEITYYRSAYGDYMSKNPISVWLDMFSDKYTQPFLTPIKEMIKVGTNLYPNIVTLGFNNRDKYWQYYYETNESKKNENYFAMNQLVRMLKKDVTDKIYIDLQNVNVNKDAHFDCGFSPVGDTTDIAAQSENFDIEAELCGYLVHRDSYFRWDEKYDSNTSLGGPELREVVNDLLSTKYKIIRYQNCLQSTLYATNRCLIYSKLPQMKIKQNDAKEVASFLHTSTRTIMALISERIIEEGNKNEIKPPYYEDIVLCNDFHYSVLKASYALAEKMRNAQICGNVKFPDYNMSAMNYIYSQIMAKACAIHIKYAPNMLYDLYLDEINDREYAHFLIRRARNSALEAISDCKKLGIPCIDPLLRFELADCAISSVTSDIVHDVLENYLRAYFGARVLVMSFHGIH